MTADGPRRPAGEPPAAAPRPPLSLVKWLMGVPITQSIYVAAKLGLADLVGDGTASCDRLAEAAGVDREALYRLLRMLVGVGLFTEVEPRRFALTRMGRYLESDRPGSVRDLAVLGGESWHLGPWTDLLRSVETGEPAFDRLHGQGFFDFLADRPEAAALFNRAMDSVVGGFAAAVAAVCDFGEEDRVVDVGGGQGTLLAEVLRRGPRLSGVLFELPGAIDSARANLASSGVLDRCTLVGGDFFAAVPEGGDAYLLSHVLHDWDDERAVEILRSCRRAMGHRGRLLAVEVVRGERADFYGSWLDLEMLVNFGGRERGEAEYAGLFESAGLRLVRVVGTESPVSVLEASPAPG